MHGKWPGMRDKIHQAVNVVGPLTGPDWADEGQESVETARIVVACSNHHGFILSSDAEGWPGCVGQGAESEEQPSAARGACARTEHSRSVR